jgi:hypothetical protein
VPGAARLRLLGHPADEQGGYRTNGFLFPCTASQNAAAPDKSKRLRDELKRAGAEAARNVAAIGTGDR